MQQLNIAIMVGNDLDGTITPEDLELLMRAPEMWIHGLRAM